MIQSSLFVSRASAAALIAIGALAVGACGSSGSSATGQAMASNDGAAGVAPSPSTDPSSGTVDSATSSLGTILVSAQGRALYLWQADVGTKSSCVGACAAAWPPLVTTGHPSAGSGVKQSLLGTTKRSDGTQQVTYGGHPLYLFKGDTASGQTNGQGSDGFGALWYVLSPGGKGITASPPSAGASGSDGSSTGY